MGMNKLLLLNFKRKSRNFKPELKNLKPNVPPEQRLRNNALNFPENSKSSLKDLKKLVVPLLLKSNLINAANPRWLNSDVILKNPTWPTNQLSLLSAKNKPTKSVNFPNPLTISNVSNKNS